MHECFIYFYILYLKYSMPWKAQFASKHKNTINVFRLSYPKSETESIISCASNVFSAKLPRVTEMHDDSNK